MIAAVVVPAIAVIAVIGVVVAYFGQAGRDADGAITSAGSLTPPDLQVGDCFDDPDDLTDGPIEIAAVAAVPCSEPHDNEVFHTFDLTGDELPPDEILLEQLDLQCLDAFQHYVGPNWFDADLDLFPLSPTDEGFRNGDRRVVCSLYALDYRKLEGSMRNSGR